MKIGFTSTTFRPIKDKQKIVDLAVSAGVDVIEWGGDIHVKTVSDAVIAKQMCDKANIEISSYGSYYRVGSNKKEYWAEICKIASTLGAKYIRVWLGTCSSKKVDDNLFKIMLEDLRHMCDKASEYGLVVCPECHNNTSNDCAVGFLRFSDVVDRPNFKTYFQSYYKDLAKDFDRIDKVLSHTDLIHISYSEQMRDQLFAKHDKFYSQKLLEKFLSLDYDKIVLLEYTHFSSPKFFVKHIDRLKSDLKIEK